MKQILTLTLVSLLLLTACTTAMAEDFLVSDGTETNRILVAYFSRTGNTAAVAATIAEQTGGDLFEIVPKDPYPEDYDETVAQYRQESAEDVRPAVVSTVENMEEYGVVFVGYPIWGGDMPHVVRSFLEQYDLDNKLLVPFCTHGGSRFGSSLNTLVELCPASGILGSFEIRGSLVEGCAEDIAQWLPELDLESVLGTARTLPPPAMSDTFIRFSWDGREMTVRLADNDAARNLAALLPLALPAEEYRGFQMNITLPDDLDVGSASGECDVFAGDMAYYAPWRQVTFFYEDFGYAEDLTYLGRVESGLEHMTEMDSGSNIVIELADE